PLRAPVGAEPFDRSAGVSADAILEVLARVRVGIGHGGRPLARRFCRAPERCDKRAPPAVREVSPLPGGQSRPGWPARAPRRSGLARRETPAFLPRRDWR